MAFSDHVKMLIGADTQGLNDGLSKAEGRAKQFGDKFKKYFVGALGTAALVKTTNDVIDFASKIENMGKRLGVTNEFLQAFQYGAEQSGIKADSAAIALQRFARRTQEAKQNGGPLKKTLEDIGISFTTTEGRAKTTEELFSEFGETLANMENPAKKLRTAFQFLDTEGAALTQMFTKGGKSIADYEAEAKRLGILMDNNTITSLREAGDTLEKLGRQFKVTAANFLPPFIDGLQKIADKLSGTFRFFQKYAGEITSLVAVIATYKVASLAFTMVAPIIGGLTAVANAVRGTTVAVTALNVATKANPFGLIIAGAVALGIGLTKLIGHFNKAENEMKKWADTTNAKAKKAMQEFAFTIDSAQTELQALRAEIGALQGKKIDLSAEELAKHLQDVNVELKKNKKQVDEQIATFERYIGYQDENIAKLKKAGHSEAYINKELAKRQGYVAEIALKKVEQAKLQKKILENEKELNPAVQKVKDLEFARANDMLKILQNRSKEQVELDRTVEKTKALTQAGEEGLKVVEARHELEDKIKELIKDGKMPLEDAVKLAKQIVNAKEAENRAIVANKQKQDLLKQAEAERKRLAGLNADEQERIVRALADQLQQQGLAKQDAQDQLRILDLMAQGRDKEAQALKDRIAQEEEIARIMKQQGLNANDARNQLERKLELENKIELKKLDQLIQDEKNGAVARMLAKEKDEIITREDRKRRRAAENVERLEKQINRAIEEGGAKAEERVENLRKLQEKHIAVVIDEDTTKDIEELKKQRTDLMDNHAAQLAQLNLAQANAQALQDVVENEAIAQNAALQALGLEMKDKLKEEIKAGEDAIVKAGEANKTAVTTAGETLDKSLEQTGKETVQAINKIANPVVNVNVDTAGLVTDIVSAINGLGGTITSAIAGVTISPVVNVQAPTVVNTIQVDINSELTEQTQLEILETLQGYFINQ